MSLKVLHIADCLDGASGVVTFIRELSNSLETCGVKSVEIADVRQLYRHEDADIVHIHGLWLYMFHIALRWSLERRKPIVWSTHGMTAPWSMRHKRWKKLPAWWMYQEKDLMRASVIHCTTEQEVEWNKALGFRNFLVVPLGTKEELCSETLIGERRRLLFVGRLYPVKGLVNLVKAWAMVCTNGEIKNWRLRIVGPDEAGHMAELESLVARLGIIENVEFAGPKFGQELSREYDECDCLALPSYTENFGATVVDALAHGKPCIASTFTPWQELVERGCGWWVSNEPKILAATICEMIGVGASKRREMGMMGRKLVEEKYTWDAVVSKMVAGYRDIAGC